MQERSLDKCIYCGSTAYGNCSRNAATGCCIPVEGKCSYCGSGIAPKKWTVS